MPRMTQAEYQAFCTRHCQDQPPATAGDDREAGLHQMILAECKRRGWVAFHGSMVCSTARNPGEPDFQIALPNGEILFVECKSKTGKLSAEQVSVRHQLRGLGHEVHVVRSFGEFMDCAMRRSECCRVQVMRVGTGKEDMWFKCILCGEPANTILV